MVEKSLKYIENKCPHCALQLILIGKDAHCKGNIRHVTNWSQVISGNFSCLFRPKIAKITKDECTHGAMDFDFSFPWLSKIPLHRIIALWVHPYNHLEPLLKRCTHRATEALSSEPTESIDGNNHQNKTIKFWSNGITRLYRKCMVFPLKDSFSIENGL